MLRALIRAALAALAAATLAMPAAAQDAPAPAPAIAVARSDSATAPAARWEYAWLEIGFGRASWITRDHHVSAGDLGRFVRRLGAPDLEHRDYYVTIARIYDHVGAQGWELVRCGAETRRGLLSETEVDRCAFKRLRRG